MGAVRTMLKTDIFKDSINKKDIVNMMDAGTFSIQMTESKFKEIDEWIQCIPNFRNEMENKLWLVFFYRLGLAVKLGVRPADLQFVGVAKINVPLSIVGCDGERRNLFFILHPIELRNYNASIRATHTELTYFGSKVEPILPPYVIVFAAPDPTKINYSLNNHPFYYVDYSFMPPKK